MSDFPLARIAEFVRSVPPFDTLSPEELARVVSRMDIAYFPAGEVVVRQGGEPARFLHVIHSGSVKLTSSDEDGRESLVDVRGEGDTFGSLSLLHSEHGHFTVTAQEDLLAFVLPAEDFRELVETHSGFQRHYRFSLVRPEQTIRGLTEGFLVQMTGAEPLGEMAMQMHDRVEALMSREVLFCPPDDTVRQAARRMSERRVGSIVVVNGTGQPLGVVTDTDLRNRVLAAGLDPEQPVETVMSSPVKTLPPRAFAFEAMLEMTRQNVHHLVVSDGGRPLGIISDHDINVITGSSPVGLVSQIAKVDSLAGLARLPRRIYRVLNMLLRMGVSAEYMVDLLAEFSDLLTTRLMDLTLESLAEEGWGEPPAPFAWLAVGAVGRREPLPPARREFVLAYQPVGPERADQAQRWFAELDRRVREGLAGCGCFEAGAGPAGAASCRPLEDWLGAYRAWINEPSASELDRAAPYFDLRPVHDAQGLAAGLWRKTSEAVERNRIFLRILARAGFDDQLPLGFLRQFVVEQNGEYAARLDLDGKVLQPLVSGVRVLALDGRVTATGTFDRLEAVAGRGLITSELASGLHEAFSFLALVKIARYLEARAQDAEPEASVEAGELNRPQRRMLKETFAVVAELQKLMHKRYGARLAGGAE
jgi:CBS domain-containing protein